MNDQILDTYLAEKAKLQPFVDAQNDALRKLERLREHDGEVWDLLRRRITSESREEYRARMIREAPLMVNSFPLGRPNPEDYETPRPKKAGWFARLFAGIWR